MTVREYPPGVILHAPHCIEGGTSPAVPIDAAYRTYPSRQLHFCFGGMVPPGLLDMVALQEIMPYVVIEQVEYGAHLYNPSAEKPDDAARALCRKCRGTHGDAGALQPSDLSGRPR